MSPMHVYAFFKLQMSITKPQNVGFHRFKVYFGDSIEDKIIMIYKFSAILFSQFLYHITLNGLINLKDAELRPWRLCHIIPYRLCIITQFVVWCTVMYIEESLYIKMAIQLPINYHKHIDFCWSSWWNLSVDLIIVDLHHWTMWSS